MARMIDADALLEKLQRMIDYCKNDNQVNGLTALFQIGDAIMDCPTLIPPNEWVSVEERLPKYNIREDGELISSKILCYCETDKTVHLVVSQKFYTGRKGEIVHPVFRYYDEWGDEIENVSHWMPLPAPPKKEE